MSASSSALSLHYDFRRVVFNSFTANCARIGWEKWIPAWLLESVASEIQAKIQRSDARKEKHNTK